MSASPAAKRSATRSCRWHCSQPRLAVLDETDFGLDIDALRVVADGVNRLRAPDRSMIVITHYQRLLNYIVPDVVHVMAKGRVVKSGGKELALELEATGYAQFADERPEERGSARHQDPGRSRRLRSAFAAMRGTLARQGRGRGLARRRVHAVRRQRPAASACRGMEIHRSARADARSETISGTGGRQAEGRHRANQQYVTERGAG